MLGLGVAGAGLLALATLADGYLAPNAPLGQDGSPGATTLIVEGWMDAPDVEQAAIALRRGHYLRVITTGGALARVQDAGSSRSYAEWAALYLRTHGVDAVPVVAVVTPASRTERTYDSARAARAWAARNGVVLDRVDVFSTGVHARRTRWLYEMALGRAARVGVLAADPQGYDPARWWRTSEGSKRVLMESMALIWTGCCFWPTESGAP